MHCGNYKKGDASILQDAISEFEQGKIVKPGTRSIFSPTGEIYFSIDTQRFSRKQDAIQEWFRLAREYASGRKGTLYWRHHPELDDDRGGWKVTGRLLISSKATL